MNIRTRTWPSTPSCGPCRSTIPNLAVTGDPDQSIYGWRGANLSNILEFEKDFPQVKVVRLEQNYRCTKAILRVADELIRHNVRRKEKRALHRQRRRAAGAADGLSHAARRGRRHRRPHRRARFAPAAAGRAISPIFYRTNALSRQLEHSLREHVVPYQIVNGLEFYQRKEIKDVLAYLHLLNNPRDDVALLRIINTPTRGIGKATIDQLARLRPA